MDKFKIASYSFIEVQVFPKTSMRYFALVKDGHLAPYIFSEEHLYKCFCALEILNDSEHE